ncbi:unnamed protein product [Brachionus calyciflorus]|uniref:Bulb-type lectin domain-containing protein n=1 Tax=Brachionus calyciflorus TaxID=104777 RepID=A0A814G172_9BILA|nr:unnamed protein product [Brachionus calyciflorus]
MSNILYELNPYEKYCYNICTHGDFLVLVTTIIESQSENLLTEELVKKACVYLQNRHPTLRSYVERQHDKVYIKLLEDNYENKINLKWLDLTNKTVTRDELTRIAEQENSELFDLSSQKDLLWRLQIVSFKENEKLKYMVNLTMGFFATDGFNMCALNIELINVLNSLLTGQQCKEMFEKFDKTEDLYELSEKSHLVKENNFKVIEQRRTSPLPKLLLSEKLKTNNEKGFKLDFLKLDEETTKNILKISKQNAVKMTGFFYMVSLYALRDLYGKYEIEFPSDVLIGLAASLRIRYNPVLDFSPCRTHICNFETLLEDCEFKNFWHDARMLNELIRKETDLENGVLFTVTHDYEGLNEFNEYFLSDKSKEDILNYGSHHSTLDFAYSNLGPYVNDNVSVVQGPLCIKEIYCSDSLQTEPAISISIIHHVIFWRGEIMFQFGANKSKIDSDKMNEYIENFKKRVEQLSMLNMTNTINSDSILWESQYLVSQNGIFIFNMQNDGNFVLYNFTSALWSSGSFNPGKEPYFMKIQADGNLVIFDKNRIAFWATNYTVKGHPPYRLILQNTGKAVIYDYNQTKNLFKILKDVYILDPVMPSFLKNNESQLSPVEANKSRLVTKCRWVVEVTNSFLKRSFRDNKSISKTELNHALVDYKIIAALINKYFKFLFPDIDNIELARKMKSKIS